MTSISKILVIVGTRPQIIKTQPLLQELEKKFDVSLVNTGQHYDYNLSDIIFSDLKIKKPTINLNVGKGTYLQQISKILHKLEAHLSSSKPDLIIVPGDTTSALAGGIAASKSKIKLAHLEAGARSNQFYMNEEVNRRILDHSSDLLFAPTQNCLKNLKKESVYGDVFFTGDTMYDLFLMISKKQNWDAKRDKKKILVTIHRSENIDQRNNLKKICSLLESLHKRNHDIVFPIHPHTKQRMKKFNISLSFKTTNPVGYSDTMELLSEASLIITDSGGLQKEAYWMGRPCVTVRDNTEWMETISEKANMLLKQDKPWSINAIEKMSEKKISPKKKLFGGGRASQKISQIIEKIQS